MIVDVNQDQALEILKSGKNIFLTGNAGSGKTHLAKEFAKKSKHNIALTATTGIAALNLGGDTIHRFLGLGITARPEHADLVLKKWKAIKKSKKPWDQAKWALVQNVEIIIIDEASMLRSDQLDLIEIVLSSLRDHPKPFGGVQIILVGDFFQLPPVVTPYDEKKYVDLSNPFCFQSQSWHHGKFYSINLNTNYRQSDQLFLDVLNKIRYGVVDTQVDATMSSRVGVNIDGDIRPIRLFTHKINVETENIECLKKINEPKYRSVAEFTGKKINVEILMKDCPADEKLYFCKGAQIMMLTNDPKGSWVNGSMGIITCADPVVIKLANGKTISPSVFKWERVNYKLNHGRWEKEVVATMSQYPFKLAYATTIHKSQGLTLDYVDLDIENCFAAGQAYVALSRVKSLDGLSLRGWEKDVIVADDRVKQFYKKGSQ